MIIGFNPCAKKFYVDETQLSMVCVCNATYCDDVAPLGNVSPDSATVYVSSYAGKRLERSTLTWTHAKTISIASNPNKGKKSFVDISIFQSGSR